MTNENSHRDAGYVCADCGSLIDDDGVCLCTYEYGDDDEYADDEYDYDDSMDGDHDSCMRDIGWGTDEDYGYYGDNCDY